MGTVLTAANGITKSRLPRLDLSVSKKSNRVCRPWRQQSPKNFLPGRVPGRKHFSGCKCGICPPTGDKLCAQQTAKVCRKSLQGFFDSLRLHTNMQPFKMFTKSLRESLIRAPLGTPEGTRDTKVSPRSSPGRATRPRRVAFKWFESLPQRIQKARHPNGCLAFWYAGRDSNPQPSEPESDALSIEPPAHALTAKLL